MAIIGWLVVAAAGGLIHKGIKNARERAAEEERRKKTPCYFVDGITQEQFEAIARKAGRRIKRLTNLSVDGPVVYGTVETQSGLSEWYFKVDFNDYGHITGTYWLSTDNSDSSIPGRVADNISEMINSFPEGLREDDNKAKNTAGSLNFCPYCGGRITQIDALYCPHCGKNL